MQNAFCDIIVLDKLKRLKKCSNNGVAVIIVSVFVYITFAIFDIYAFSHVNELANADAAVILGASAWNNRPSPVFRERINHGIWLYKNGYVKNLIFTGGFGKNAPVSEASVAMNYAVSNAIPAEKIFMEEISRTTIESLYHAKNIIKNNNFDTIIIVSDPLHMKRSVTMARDFNLNVYSSPTQTTRYVSLKTRLQFLFYEWFYYIAYKIYRYFFVILSCIFVCELMYLMSYYSIVRRCHPYRPVGEGAPRCFALRRFVPGHLKGLETHSPKMLQ